VEKSFAANFFEFVLEAMMKSPSTTLAIILSTLALTSCGGGGSGTGPTQMAPPPPPAPIVRSYFFAPGKASASAGTVWDIIGVRTTLTGRFGNGGGNTYDTLTVDVTFTQDISNSLPLPGTALNKGNQLGIVIGLDSDDNPSTGNFLACDTANRILTPFEFFSDQGNGPTRLVDGNYSIIGPSRTPISSGPNSDPASEAVVSLSGNVLTESIFLAAIGASSGSAIPKLGIDVSSYNGANNAATDCVPADGRITLPVS
jgi:hypothetical protein